MAENEPIPVPSISPAFVAETERVARDIELSHPDNAQWLAHAAALRASVAGLAPKPPEDTRTPQQQIYDHHHGDTKMPSHLAGMIDHDKTVADPERVEAQLANIGRSYADDLRVAESLVGAEKAKGLSANSLVQLALWSQHAARIAQNRPK